MRIIIHLGLMAFTLVFAVLSLIYIKPIADWVGDKVDKFFHKEPRGKYREIAIKAGTFYIKNWFGVFITGVFVAIPFLWPSSDWLLTLPFAIFGVMFMLLGLEIRKRVKGKPSS